MTATAPDRREEKLFSELGKIILGALDDERTEDIVRNPDGGVWLKQCGLPFTYLCDMPSSKADGFIRTVASMMGVTVNRERPTLEANLSGGYRIEALTYPIVKSPTWCIRKFRSKRYSAADLLQMGTMTAAQLVVLSRSVIERKNMIISGSTGAGKALDVNTIVFTPEGQRRIGDLARGEEVIGKDGKPTRVIGVFPQGVKDAFLVTFEDDTTAICCPDHLWQVTDKHIRTMGLPPKVMSISAIREKLLRTRDPQYKLSVPVCSPLQFSKKDLPLDPYLLGVLIGDGTLGHCGSPIMISNPEMDIIESVSAALAPTGTELCRSTAIDYRIREKRVGPYVSKGRYHENPLKKAVVAMGLNVGSHEKFIPSAYLFSDVSDRLALFHGLMDTDGSPSKMGLVEYSTASEVLCRNVLLLARGLGCTCSFVKRPSHYTNNGIRVECRPSYRIHIRVPADMAPFRSKQKLARWSPRTKYKLLKQIKSIEPAGPREMVCIAVDALDGLFVIDHCVVTHNTSLLNALAEFIPDSQRILLIEDVAEIVLPASKQNVVSMESRKQQGDTPAVSIRDLLRCALRMQPDRIIIGEVRGPEAVEFLALTNTGHSGTMLSTHSNGCQDALYRIYMCALLADDHLPERFIKESIGRNVDIVVHLNREDTGQRRVVEIVEVDRYDHREDMFVVSPL